MKFKKIHGMLMGVLACFLWSTAFAGVKIGFRHLPAPLTFAGLRFTLAGLMLIPFCWRKNTLQLLAWHRKLIRGRIKPLHRISLYKVMIRKWMRSR